MTRDLTSSPTDLRRGQDEYINGVLEDLDQAVKTAASSDEGWRQFLESVSRVPEYSFKNVTWAYMQLRHKGMDDPKGLYFSESAWRALGRRVKESHLRSDSVVAPDGQVTRLGKHDQAYGYEPGREFDPSLTVEQMQPADMRRFPLRDENGQIKTDPETGEQIWLKQVISYRPFWAYHEDAVEIIPSLAEKEDWVDPLSTPEPWAGATGSERDAGKLLDAVREVCQKRDITLSAVSAEQLGSTAAHAGSGNSRASSETDAVRSMFPGFARVEPSGPQSDASYDRSSKTIAYNAEAPVTEQATSALRALCEAVGRSSGSSDEDRMVARAATESAKHVIASLYGLDSEEQSFPYLAQLAASEKGSQRLAGETHARVKAVLAYLDPKMKIKAAHAAEYRRERAEKRQARGGTRAQRRRQQRTAAPQTQAA